MVSELLRPPYLAGSPSFETLMSEPTWRKLHTAPAPLPRALRPEGSTPWVLWCCSIRNEDNRIWWAWSKREYVTHAEAWNAWVRLRKVRTDAVDWSIVCKPKVWARPQGLVPPPIPGQPRPVWCGRCRRPVGLRPWGRHRAIHTSPLLLKTEPVVRMRCAYCGYAPQHVTLA